MSIQLDTNTLKYFQEKWATKLKIFFYEAGCSGTKVDITDDFEVDESLICHSELAHPKNSMDSESLKGNDINYDPVSSTGWQEHESWIQGINIYVPKKDAEKFENCRITRTVKADHTGKEKVRYIFTSEQVKGRCGCGSSFNFTGAKKPKIDMEKLKQLKKRFG